MQFVRAARLWLCCAAFAGAIGVFAAAQWRLLRIDSWWADELFTLWATAPHLGFAQTMQRIGPDPTPPLYYAVLRLLRQVIDLPIQQERLEILALNCGFMLAAGAAVLASARRHGLLRLGLLAMVGFALSGCALVFAPEARAYCLALCVVFTAAWAIGAAVTRPEAAWSLRRLGLIGLLAAFSHSFAALACGSLAAGAIAAGLLERRRDLRWQGFALGTSATAGCLLRLLLTTDAHAALTLDWISFTPASAWRALEGIYHMEIGSIAGLASLALAAAGALAARQTRGLAVCFLVAVTLSLGLPALASFVVPMFLDRYLMIGGPLLVVAAAFWTQARPGAGFALGFLLLSSMSGLAEASLRTESKLGWHGAAVVRSAAAACPAHSIRVTTAMLNAAGLENYALAAQMPADRFEDGTDPSTAWQEVTAGACPVLGWSEHAFSLVTPGYVANATDQELLARLKLTGTPGQFDILRHATGYVVMAKPSR